MKHINEGKKIREALSVFALCVRLTLLRTLAVTGVALFAEIALFAWAYVRYPGSGVGVLFGEAHLQIPVALSLVGALYVCQRALNNGKSRVAYTTGRLGVSEKRLWVLHAAAASLCLLLVWCAQTAILLGLARFVYARADASLVTSQSLYLSVMHDGLLHNLLPLDEGIRYVRNAVWCMTGGICAALYAAMQRRGQKSIAVYGCFFRLGVLVVALPDYGGDELAIAASVLLCAGVIARFYIDREDPDVPEEEIVDENR